MTSTKYRIHVALTSAALGALLMLPVASHADGFYHRINFDFVNDRAFPTDSDGREVAAEFDFLRRGLRLRVTAVDQNGAPADVQRRDPGGLGVVGNGDRDQPDGGTTSGNRINSGESLRIEALNRYDRPRRVRLVSATFSRIIRDLENFPDTPQTRFSLEVDGGPALVGGVLDPEQDDVTVVFRQSGLFVTGDTFTFGNGVPFDDIANRYRLSSISLQRLPRRF